MHEDTTRFSGVEFSISIYESQSAYIRSFDCQRVELDLEWFHSSSVSTRWQSKLR